MKGLRFGACMKLDVPGAAAAAPAGEPVVDDPDVAAVDAAAETRKPHKLAINPNLNPPNIK